MKLGPQTKKKKKKMKWGLLFVDRENRAFYFLLVLSMNVSSDSRFFDSALDMIESNSSASIFKASTISASSGGGCVSCVN